MEPPDESLDDTNPLLKHQWVHHQGQQPEFWAKVLTKHFTAFSRQVREGVIINKMAKENDLILNSKREVVGNRITRKRVLINGEPLDLLIGDTSSLEPQERKLLAELEEGGEDYIDREL